MDRNMLSWAAISCAVRGLRRTRRRTSGAPTPPLSREKPSGRGGWAFCLPAVVERVSKPSRLNKGMKIRRPRLTSFSNEPNLAPLAGRGGEVQVPSNLNDTLSLAR